MVICCIFAYSQKENCSLLDFCPMYNKKSILFVLNPKSGVHNKSALPKLIENYIDKSKFEYAIVETKYKGHASKLASEAVAEKVDIVVAVGGDGTVNEIGCSLVGTGTALGILPCGSGNGLARHLGIPLVLKNAIEYINKAAVVSVDYGKINGTPFFCTCGIGYDAFVSETFSKGKRRGLVGYANNASINNCFVKDIDVSSEKDGILGIGGIIGILFIVSCIGFLISYWVSSLIASLKWHNGQEEGRAWIFCVPTIVFAGIAVFIAFVVDAWFSLGFPLTSLPVAAGSVMVLSAASFPRPKTKHTQD